MRNPKSFSSLPFSLQRYYGFSVEFADDALRELNLADGARVLDPWNGSGTTTLAAARRRLRCSGVDLNPVMGIVARSRLMSSSTALSVPALAAEIVGESNPECDLDPSDPLLQWLWPRGAAQVRSVDRTIRQLLIDGPDLRLGRSARRYLTWQQASTSASSTRFGTHSSR